MDKINAEVFVTVSDLGSYKKAADKLGYTQAGISYIVNSMEEQTGLKLFEREFGGVKLTQDGRQLLPLMQKLYQDEKTVWEQISRIGGLETGHIKLLAFNTVVVCYLPDILHEFGEIYPGIEIELATCDSPQRAIRMILAGDVDCAFIQLPKHDKIELSLLCNQQDMAVVADDHPFAKEKVFPIKSLGKYPFIGCSEEQDSYVHDIARNAGVTLNQIMTVDNDYGCFSMISKGFGFGIYPKVMVESNTFPVTGIPFDVELHTDISIGYKSYDSLSLASKAFVDFVKDWDFN